ncbi:hypothetical protein Dimus_015425 [Dionaea muscipula]
MKTGDSVLDVKPGEHPGEEPGELSGEQPGVKPGLSMAEESRAVSTGPQLGAGVPGVHVVAGARRARGGQAVVRQVRARLLRRLSGRAPSKYTGRAAGRGAGGVAGRAAGHEVGSVDGGGKPGGEYRACSGCGGAGRARGGLELSEHAVVRQVRARLLRRLSGRAPSKVPSVHMGKMNSDPKS